MRIRCFFVCSFCLTLFSLLGCNGESSKSADVKQTPSEQTEPGIAGTPEQESGSNSTEPVFDTRMLFDGSSLDNWEVTRFGGEGECSLENGEMIVEMGNPMSGMTCTIEDLPKMNYEISLEAKRVDGIDFFCCLTFPVADSHCSFIVGGWAGSLVGLSCIDGKDASDNETKVLLSFEDDRWYKIRVSVEPEKIRCWIDDEEVVDFDTSGRKISLRNETLPSRPLGLGTFQTKAAYRNIELKTGK